MDKILAVTRRQTKYTTAVIDALAQLKHATNLELLQKVRRQYPEVSATTIHRVSARLRERGIIAGAPKPADGSVRYDTNPEAHHHFMCMYCGRVCDVPETAKARAIIKQLKELSADCAIAGTLTMQGVCTRCKDGNILISSTES